MQLTSTYYKEVVRLVIFDTEGHKIACSYTLKETHTDAPNIPIYSSYKRMKDTACMLLGACDTQ
jgi:hypothetical protein